MTEATLPRLDTHWQDYARCRGQDTNRFYPHGSVGAAKVQVNAARRFCRPCPVRRECLEYALSLPLTVEEALTDAA